MTSREYDLIVIGAGPVGENVADRATQGGLSVVVVESELVGGECSYWACMPSKALLRPGAALRAARAVDGAAQAVTGRVDVAAALRRRDELVHHWDDTSQVEWLHGAGIDLVRGHGRLTGEREVTVDRRRRRRDRPGRPPRGRRLHRFGGAAPRHPRPARRPAVDEPRSHRRAAMCRHRSRCSAAASSAARWRRCSRRSAPTVTVIARSGLLGGVEPFAGEAVAKALTDAGAAVRTGVEVERASRDE